MAKQEQPKRVIKLIKKSNELVEARYKFDIRETRVFTKMLTMIEMNDEEFKSYRIYLNDIVKEMGIENSKASYERLRMGWYKLMTKIIKVVRSTEEGLMELTTPIVVGVDKPLDSEPETARFIDVSFHPVMKPFLLSLKSHFTTYDARNILKLPSTYSIRIYELLKQYEKIGKRRFGLQELKEIIWVIEEVEIKGKKTFEDTYPLYGNFRQRVLLKAQEDLEKYTDIRFEFKPIKKGRTIREIMFTIFPNTPEWQDYERPTFQDRSQEELFQEFYPLVKKRVAEGTVRKWIQTLPEEKIRKGITYTLHQLDNWTKIDNVGGYLNNMVRQDSLFDPVEERVLEHDRKVEQAQERQKYVDGLTQEINELKKRQHQEEYKILEQLLDDSVDLVDECIRVAKENKLSTYKSTKSFDENFTTNILFRSFLLAYVKKIYPDLFAETEAQFAIPIETLEQKLLAL